MGRTRSAVVLISGPQLTQTRTSLHQALCQARFAGALGEASPASGSLPPACGFVGHPLLPPSLHFRKPFLSHGLAQTPTLILTFSSATKLIRSSDHCTFRHSQSPPFLSGATTEDVSRTSGFLLLFLCPPHPTTLAAP